MMHYLKGNSSKLLQDAFPKLKKRYCGQQLWAKGYFCATAETLTHEIIQDCIGNPSDEGEKEIFIIGE